ncbi:MAG: hypothetical protein KIS92_24270 [Planctomycetota bacterium]|nr:hypothetical protein [Planctomycetota bacterium]
MRAHGAKRGWVGVQFACALALAAAFVRAEEPQPAPKLEAAREWLAELVPLTLADGRLALASIPSSAGEAGDPVRKLMINAVTAVGGKITGTARDANVETYEAESASGFIGSDAAREGYTFQLSEKAGERRKLAVRWSKAAGLSIVLVRPARESYACLTQAPDGSARLMLLQGDAILVHDAAAFEGLLKEAPDKLQIHLLRQLADVGITLPPSRFLPVCMAAATSGFGASSPEAAKQADELIAKLSAEKPEDRDAATGALIRLYPFAVRKLSAAADSAENADVKARLAKVVAAHPGIAKALPWVEAQKLHEDRAYLREILARVPFFKAAARQRLAELYGKDYGDDAAAWPAEPGK